MGTGGTFRAPDVLGPVSEVLGSRFLAHPPIAAYQVDVVSNSQLVAGLSSFSTTDELYISALYPPLRVLLQTRYSGPCRGFELGRGRLTTNRGRCCTGRCPGPGRSATSRWGTAGAGTMSQDLGRGGPGRTRPGRLGEPRVSARARAHAGLGRVRRRLARGDRRAHLVY